MIKVGNLTPEEEKKRQEVYKKNWQKLMSREAYVFEQGYNQGIMLSKEVLKELQKENNLS